MEINDIDNLEKILAHSHQDPGQGGRWLDSLFGSIGVGNPNFSLEQSFEALIVVLRFLIENDLAYLMRYDEQQQKVIHWKGKGEDVLEELKTYLNDYTENKIDKNPAFLDMFKYPALDWTVKWPLDLKKYGYEN